MSNETKPKPGDPEARALGCSCTATEEKVGMPMKFGDVELCSHCPLIPRFYEPTPYRSRARHK